MSDPKPSDPSKPILVPVPPTPPEGAPGAGFATPVAPAAVPPAEGPEGPADNRPQYEFSEAQNAVINEMVTAILWVRVPLIVVGVLQGLIAVGLAFRLPKDGAHIVGVLGHGLAGVVCFLLAQWLLRAAAAFTRVTTTTGRDITHLMTGIRNLGAWFDLLAFFVKLYLFLLGVLVILLVIGHFTGSFKEPIPVPPAD